MAFLQWRLKNKCQAIVILLNFSNKFKLTDYGIPLLKKYLTRWGK